MNGNGKPAAPGAGPPPPQSQLYYQSYPPRGQHGQHAAHGQPPQHGQPQRDGFPAAYAVQADQRQSAPHCQHNPHGPHNPHAPDHPQHQHHSQHKPHFQQPQPMYFAGSRLHGRQPVYQPTAQQMIYNMPVPLYASVSGIPTQFQQQQPPPQRQGFYQQPGAVPSALGPGQPSYNVGYPVAYASAQQPAAGYYLHNGGAQAAAGAQASAPLPAAALPSAPQPQPPPQQQQQPALQPALQPYQPPPHQTYQPQQRRPHALFIVDPESGRNVLDDMFSEKSAAAAAAATTAARPSPQPADEPRADHVKDEFKLKVLVKISEDVASQRPPPPRPVAPQPQPPTQPQPQPPHAVEAPPVADTPVVSAISDSPEIVPKQSSVAPKAARPRTPPPAKSEPRPEPEPEPQMQTQTEAAPEPEPEPHSEPAAPPEPEPELEAKSEPDSEMELEPTPPAELEIQIPVAEEALPEPPIRIEEVAVVVDVEEEPKPESPPPPEERPESPPSPVSDERPEVEDEPPEAEPDSPAAETASVEETEAPVSVEARDAADEKTDEPVETDEAPAPPPPLTNGGLSSERPEDEDEKKPPVPPALKYPYKDGQWSPLNTTGVKIYDTEFLLALRLDPMSMKKPDNIKKLEMIISDAPQKHKFPASGGGGGGSRGGGGGGGGDGSNLFSNLHESLVPDFARNLPPRCVMPGRKSQQGGKSGSKNGGSPASAPSKPPVIHVSLSLREDVKLNEAENAWKPTRLKTQAEKEDEKRENEELLKKFRSILNKLTPEKFEKLITQIMALPIDTEERLKGVIDLVFEKAISEPNFALMYASLCLELKQMKVKDSNKDFRVFIISRCQVEFESVSAYENASKLKEIEIRDCLDEDKKKEMQLLLEEEERRSRRRSVGNVRFIGELYKQGMLKPSTMISCVEHLITKLEEETLECLCKFLTTIGKNLEETGINLQAYFDKMREIVAKKDKRVSSRIRFMLQDLIDLRAHSWVPRQAVANPRTMDQIQQEVEREQLSKSYLGGYPSQKEDRPSNVNKRGGSKSVNEDGWSTPRTAKSSAKQQSYTVDSGKLKGLKPNVRINEVSLQPSTHSAWGKGSNVNVTKKSDSGPTSHKAGSIRKSATETSNMFNALGDAGSESSPSASESKSDSHGSARASAERSAFNSSSLAESAAKILEIVSETRGDDVDALVDEIRPHLKMDVRFALQELVNAGMSSKRSDRSATIGKLVGKLIADGTTTDDEFASVFKQCVDGSGDAIRRDEAVSDRLSQFTRGVRTQYSLTLWNVHAALKKVIELGKGYDFLLSFFTDKTGDPDDAGRMWEEASKMELADWMSRERTVQFLEKVPLEFLNCKAEEPVTPETAAARLLRLMRQEESRDSIKKWITKNVGEAVKEGWFIRALTEAVYVFALKPEDGVEPRFDDATSKKLTNFYPLLSTFVANQEKLELECLFAIQRVVHKLEHPVRITPQIFDHLMDDGDVVSTEGFLAWETNNDPHEQVGKSVMVLSLTSFFTTLKSTDESSEETTNSMVDEDY